MSLPDEGLYARAAQVGQALRQEAIEPLAFMALVGFGREPLLRGSFI
jgi:hypothetical protein